MTSLTQVERQYVANDGKLDAYAWPGGYPILYACPDGAILCAECARKTIEANRADALLRALGAFAETDADGYELVAPHLYAMWTQVGTTHESGGTPAFCEAYYEGPTLYCDECNAEIPSAYGDPDDESDDD